MVRLVVAILVLAGTGGAAVAQPAIINVPPKPAAAAPAAPAAVPAAAPAAAGAPAAAITAAVPLPPSRPRTPPKPAWTEPRTFLEAAGPDFKSAEVTSEPSECRLRLEAIAIVTPLPRLIGPGACGGGDMVQLDGVRLPNGARIEVKPGPVLRCGMAESFASWLRDEAAPRVLKEGSSLQRVSVADDFNCRGRNRVAGARLSEHGKGNAVDIRAFTLANNKTIDLTDMHAPQDLREDMKVSICARFTTVLGPRVRRLSRRAHSHGPGRAPRRLPHLPVERARAAATATPAGRRSAGAAGQTAGNAARKTTGKAAGAGSDDHALAV